MREIELLIPAGNLGILKTAIDYGADAVYIGGEFLGLRAKAKNFTIEDIAEGIAYAHQRGKKVFITANIVAHNGDLADAKTYFAKINEVKPDAVIISDPGIFMIAKEMLQGIDFHISTQANNTNYGTYQFWWNLGARRVVSGRELSFEEIKEIRANIPQEMEIETFVHGAMCMAYSGRCMLSNYMTGRDANKGECTNPCRWKYSIVEEKRPGEYMPVYEDERGTYIFNSKDLCMIEYIPQLIEAGVDSFKIEGRQKTALYVATVARTYRKAIDDYLKSPDLYAANMEWYKSEIGKCTQRAFTTGFFFGKADSDAHVYDKNTYVSNYTYIGTVLHITKENLVFLEQKNKFCIGDEIEIMKRNGETLFTKVLAIYDMDGNLQDSAPHPSQKIYIELDTKKMEVGEMMRMKTKSAL